MPTYEYECQKCGVIFEEFQSMTDDRLTHCTANGCKGKVKRLMSTGAGVIFKGSGFYQTDYKGTKSEKAPSESKSESSSESKNDSKSKSDAGKTAGEKKPSAAPKAEKKS